jgi:hypothetical protein
MEAGKLHWIPARMPVVEMMELKRRRQLQRFEFINSGGGRKLR